MIAFRPYTTEMATSSQQADDCLLVEWVIDSTLSVETVKQIHTKERPKLDRVYVIDYREANGRINVYQGKILRIGGKLP